MLQFELDQITIERFFQMTAFELSSKFGGTVSTICVFSAKTQSNALSCQNTDNHLIITSNGEKPGQKLVQGLNNFR